MRRKERDRLTIMVGVKREELTQMQAAELLGLSCRQTKRVWRRYPAEGDAGLVPRLRGRPSLRRQPPALRAQVLGWYEDERYADFGPTLLAEPLAPAGLVVDHETLRRWLLATGKWTVEVSSILRRGLSGVERKHGRTTKKGDILS
jgi:transposase